MTRTHFISHVETTCHHILSILENYGACIRTNFTHETKNMYQRHNTIIWSLQVYNTVLRSILDAHINSRYGP